MSDPQGGGSDVDDDIDISQPMPESQYFGLNDEPEEEEEDYDLGDYGDTLPPFANDENKALYERVTYRICDECVPDIYNAYSLLPY